MELRDYVRTLRKGWPLILACLIFGAALGVGVTLATTKVYRANVQVFVAALQGDNPSQLSAGYTLTVGSVQSYTSLATSPAVLGPVITRLGLAESVQDLADNVSADAPATKVLINLHVTDTNPNTAATVANALAAQFDTVVAKTQQTDADGAAVVKLTVIHPATVPTAPIKPRKVIDIGLGVVLGLLVGLGVVVLRELLDNTMTPEDFEALGVPVLAVIPMDKNAPKSPVAFRNDPHSRRSEAYRQLRTNLQFVNVDDAPRVIAVTSAVPGEGKTTTALNLAAALAEGGFRVCLVEADLRRPNLAKALGLSTDVGFTTVLVGKATVESVLQNAGRNLAVLTCGPVPPNPSELLITGQARAVIREIAERVDFTIIDSAPLLPVTDGVEVAALADATLVVHRAGKTSKDEAARAVKALANVGLKPVGIILNMVSRSRGDADGGYGYYYAYRPARSRAKVKPAPTPAAAPLGNEHLPADDDFDALLGTHRRPAPSRPS